MEERESSVSKRSIQAPYTGPVSVGARIRASPGPVYGAHIWRAVYGPLQAPYTGPVSGGPYTGLSRPRIRALYLGCRIRDLSRPRIRALYLHQGRIRASPGPVYGPCIWGAVYGTSPGPVSASGVPYTSLFINVRFQLFINAVIADGFQHFLCGVSRCMHLGRRGAGNKDTT
jgi:hypothetical protein